MGPIGIIAAAVLLAIMAGNAAGAAQASTVAPASAALALPPPTGPHAIGQTQLHLVDAARADPFVAGLRRELMVSIWYPAASGAEGPRAAYMPSGAARIAGQVMLKPMGLDPARVDLAAVRTNALQGAPAARGRYPVVLFSPGGNFPRAMGTVLAEDLASRGYVVVAIDHTHEAPAVEFPDGRLAPSSLPKGESLLQKIIAARVADASFVLDQLEMLRKRPTVTTPRRLVGAMDLSRTGMFGHSAGGFTALQTMSQDQRIDAAANLDGSLAYSMSKGIFGEVVDRGLDRPFLLMGAGVSGRDRRPHTHEHAPDWERLWDRSRGWKREVYFAGGEHLSFADHQALLPQLAAQMNLPPLAVHAALGKADTHRVTVAQRAYVAAFFDQHLKGRSERLFNGPADVYPEARLID